MPHQVIEYSANLEKDLDIEELVDAMHSAAAGLESLPLAGIRTRAARRDVFRVADSHPDNTFINVTLRVAPRRAEVKRDIGETLFEALKDHVQTLLDTRPVALSLEIQEIDAEFRWKHGNIREYLAKRTS